MYVLWAIACRQATPVGRLTYSSAVGVWEGEGNCPLPLHPAPLPDLPCSLPSSHCNRAGTPLRVMVGERTWVVWEACRRPSCLF